MATEDHSCIICKHCKRCLTKTKKYYYYCKKGKYQITTSVFQSNSCINFQIKH